MHNLYVEGRGRGGDVLRNFGTCSMGRANFWILRQSVSPNSTAAHPIFNIHNQTCSPLEWKTLVHNILSSSSS
jgi:hypothetical protein